ncbi:Hypothetical protein ETEE_4177 [Edwardsiella anguillarum ET080813]|uniref:Uncharacterized protein n=1 Tax=Edwardsiella anguillarum ET080813 TaxID=667120 RepID=A0A076LV86_9GAMM|nr:Hypothetical protein ETEE_4177 [Edwardsiella anguillarum ET080813]
MVETIPDTAEMFPGSVRRHTLGDGGLVGDVMEKFDGDGF